MSKIIWVKCLGTLLLVGTVGCSSTTGAGGGEVIPYTSDTCIVMGSKLGSMGDPIVQVYGRHEVKFCCEPCVEEFEQDPEYYLDLLAPKEAE